MSTIHARIKQLIDDNDVVLFMKGTRMFPQCGFSARAIEVFKRCDVKFKDVNVLADAEIRDGIKSFSNWPTIPQAYVKGEFIGGSDIIVEMYETGELQKKLGVSDDSAEAETAGPPTITVSDKAREQLAAAAGDAGDDVLRLDVTRAFKYDLFFGPKVAGDWPVDVGGGMLIHVNKASGARANGMRIDFVDGPEGAGFKLENPNEPATVKPVSPKELAAWLASDETVHLLDVRGDKERALASIAAAKPLDQALLDSLAKDARIVVLCHHGVRSRNAAEKLIESGYSNVFNLTGGIDAWSATVDESVARY